MKLERQESASGLITTCLVGSSEIDLELSDSIFIPTSTTKAICDQLDPLKAMTVLDLGCGSGVIGIYASLSGAKSVVGVDVMPEACRMAELNAKRNRALNISIRCGSLFDTVRDEKFDIIVSDVSGIAEQAARNSPWYPACIPSGGPLGDELALAVVEGSRHHLKSRGRFIFPVLSLARQNRILSLARTYYGEQLTLLFEKDYPLPRPLSEKPDLIRELSDAGIISVKPRGSRLLWTLQIYQAAKL